ncbi:tyrosine-type recombinase/integrase [Sphingobium yanoikuyae]|uniref:Integrase n=1 Tax=Sphingobium yanoikuyae TaxID=13690 RepID=A0A291N072_SPHYA|nr:site-specific integrase [Sphingobium yanoikuyae]ATI80605.1 integrase [Sphingobium yanoikuyae]
MTALSLRQIAEQALGDIAGARLARTDFGAERETIWSRDLPGFGIRKYASGRQIYVVQARMGGRARTVTLCNTALISQGAALDVARRILLRAQVGEDPAEARRRTRTTPPFDRFLSLFWQRMAPKWKASTLVAHDKYRAHHLDGAFGRKGVDTITQADVARWFAQTAKRGGQGGANRSMAIMKAAFNKAEQWGLRPPNSNPCAGIKLYPQMRFARFLRQEELARLGAALRSEAADRPLHVAAIALLLLTGCRSSEISGLLWSEVVGRRLKLSDSKTGPRTVWLGEDAVRLLEAIPASGNNAIFWNACSGKPINLASFWRDFRRRHGFEGLRIHDLRHSFASHGAAMSETLPMIGKLLGHMNIQSTARYTHLDDRDLQQAAARVGDLIETLCSPRPGASKPLATMEACRGL